MTKPKLLRDMTCYELNINPERTFILPPDNRWRTIGRGEKDKCDIQIYVPPEDKKEGYETLLKIGLTVSREHAVIVHQRDGLVHIVRKTLEPTFVVHNSVKNEIGVREKIQLFVGDVLILGSGEYKMRLEDTDVVSSDSYERRVRAGDTNDDDLTPEIINELYAY